MTNSKGKECYCLAGQDGRRDCKAVVMIMSGPEPHGRGTFPKSSTTTARVTPPASSWLCTKASGTSVRRACLPLTWGGARNCSQGNGFRGYKASTIAMWRKRTSYLQRDRPATQTTVTQQMEEHSALDGSSHLASPAVCNAARTTVAARPRLRMEVKYSYRPRFCSGYAACIDHGPVMPRAWASQGGWLLGRWLSGF